MLTYTLPRELIAKEPSQPRDSARLLVLPRTSAQFAHHAFRDLPTFLKPGDCLVLNDTRVYPARCYGESADTGGRVELLLLEQISTRYQSEKSVPGTKSRSRYQVPKSEIGTWYRCIGQPGKRLRPGSRLTFYGGDGPGRDTLQGSVSRNRTDPSLQAEVVAVEAGERIIRFMGEDVEKTLERLGEMPLPPYIDRPAVPKDADWYQTVFARHPGAVAAPAAGLHFTEGLLNQLREQGVQVLFLTLHVGWGTFKPVGEEEWASGRLHPERFEIPAETLAGIAAAKRADKRVIAVGTTVVRALESTARSHPRACEDRIPAGVYPRPRSRAGMTECLSGKTELFIREPYAFKMVDGMITNFHLPGTSLLHLVAAFAGRERVLAAYEEAVRQRYRFYSYGDAMFIQ